MNQKEQHLVLALALSAMRNLAAADLALNPQQRGVINATVGMIERMGDYYGIHSMGVPIKIAVYHGEAYVVPAFANWLATDEDGSLYAYRHRPTWDAEGEAWELAEDARVGAAIDAQCWCIACDRDDLPGETSLVEVAQ